jgi:putative addiction module antidote
MAKGSLRAALCVCARGYAMLKLKVITIGSALGVILPKEALSRMNVGAGDSIFLIDENDGFRVIPVDPEFEKAIETARKVMKGRRNALRQLAK